MVMVVKTPPPTVPRSRQSDGKKCGRRKTTQTQSQDTGLMDALPSFFSNWLVTSRLRIALATDGAWEPGNLWGLWPLLIRGSLQLLRGASALSL